MNEQTGGTDRLRSLLKALAERRKWASDVREEIAHIETNLHKTPEWLAMQERLASVKLEDESITDLIGTIREIGHEVAVELENKKPAPGLEVRKKSTFEITDEGAATAWAKEHLPMAFKLDNALFKKLVTAMPEAEQAKVSGVSLTVDEFGDVRIATDLSAYLVEHEKSGFRNVTP